MYFTAKFTSLLLAVAASAASAQAAAIARSALAEVSVVFWDDVNLTGASYSPDDLVQGVCNTLPGNWLDRAESLEIDAGYTCTFYTLEACEGTGVALSGTTDNLIPATLYNDIESFICGKDA